MEIGMQYFELRRDLLNCSLYCRSVQSAFNLDYQPGELSASASLKLPDSSLIGRCFKARRFQRRGFGQYCRRDCIDQCVSNHWCHFLTTYVNTSELIMTIPISL